jgi:hypothetical protein
MLRHIKRALIVLAVLLVAGFLHYTLPQRDIVYITQVHVKYETFGENSWFWASPEVGTNISEGMIQRDVRFIDTIRPNGKTSVYRNEDTGWSWPPYFKFDSADLQAASANLVSAAAAPKWVAITHYGWRIQYFNIYPNAVAVRAVEGPDVFLVPWLNIVILLVLAGLVFLFWRMAVQFRERVIDPATDRVAQTLDAVDARTDAARDHAVGVWGRFRAWLGTWQGKPRR